MKRILPFIVAFYTVTFSAQAQTNKEEHQNARLEKVAGAIQNKLNLTDAQTMQWKKIKTSTMEKTKAIQNDQSLTKDQKRTQLMALHQDAQQQISAILTPEQQTKFKSLKEDMKAKWKEKREERKNKTNS
ncbi:MAG TPA: hypothetical protein PK772_07035 [Chitinophagaceae bacterium]|nr:hypothetical protein [Chitinophagaceae bacterium]